MATRLTKKQQTQLTEKLTGVIQKNNALQLRLSADRSVNEMNVNQISRALNRIHGQAIGKELPTEITIPVKQPGSGDPSPDNIRPIVGYEITGIGNVYGGELNTETGVLTVTWGAVDMGDLTYTYSSSSLTFNAGVSGKKEGNFNMLCEKYKVADTVSIAKMLNNQIKGNSNTGSVYIKDAAYTAAGAFKTACAGVMLAYELETPETYTLTPEQMLQMLDQL